MKYLESLECWKCRAKKTKTIIQPTSASNQNDDKISDPKQDNDD